MSGQRRVLGGWGQVGLVAGRRSASAQARSFQVSTGLLVLVIVALGVIVRVGVGDGPVRCGAVVDADGGASSRPSSRRVSGPTARSTR